MEPNSRLPFAWFSALLAVIFEIYPPNDALKRAFKVIYIEKRHVCICLLIYSCVAETV